MPEIPYIISGTIKNSDSVLISNATISVTTTGTKITTTDSSGQYVLDLAGTGYTSGQNATYVALDRFQNEIASGEITLTGQIQTLNLTLSVKTDADNVKGNRDTQIYNIGAKAVSKDNPFPVSSLNSSNESINPSTKESIDLISDQFQKTAFDELSVAEVSPVVQVQFPYNINTDIWEIRDNNGTSSVVNNKANLSTGASANQSSTILSRTPIKYNPGQGALIRYTALYTQGVANSTQWVGIGNSTDGYCIGFNGVDFGILRRHGGLPETRRLKIDTKSSDIDSITITLNGDTKAVSVTEGADATETANEISSTDFSNVGEGWEVHNMGDRVFFTSFTTGAKTGTYSLTDATSAVGTFTQSLVGINATDSIINQTNWNHDKMDGSGDSGMTLDPTKGNVYQIRYQWLGFGLLSFFIEDEITGKLVLIHHIHYANKNTLPSVNNPTLPLYASVRNTSNTSNVVLQVGSMGGFVEGRDTLKGLPNSLVVETTGIGTTETPVMTIHSHDIYQSTLNRVKIKMTLGSVSVDGTKNSIIRIRKNATIVGANFSSLNSNTSTIQKDTSATTVSGGTIVFATNIEKVGKVIIDLEKLGITLVAPDYLTVTIQATAAASIDAVTALNWQELF